MNNNKDNIRLIVLIQTRLNSRIVKRLRPHLITSKNIKLEVCSVGPIINKKAFMSESVGSYPINQSIMFSRKQYEAYMLENSDAFVVNEVPYSYKSHFVFWILRKYDIDYSISRDFSNVDSALKDENNRHQLVWVLEIMKLVKRMFSGPVTTFFERVYRRVPLSFLGVRASRIVFTGGSKSLLSDPLIRGKTEIVNIHAIDYDEFLDEENDLSDVDIELNEVGSYAVFVDQNLPYNTDPLYTGTKRVATEGAYFSSINQFFEVFEELTKFEIVIAAHPKADYGHENNPFGGRKIVYNDSLRTIKKSQFVLAHYSKAINFAVLYRVPIVILTTKELEESFRSPAIDAVATALGIAPFNVDASAKFDLSKAKRKNYTKYLDYQEKYIKKEDSINDYFWNVASDAIIRVASK